MEYTRATARHLAPLAQAATVIPGVPDASGALTALPENSWLKEKQKTAAEMRTEIADKIVEMDLSFIILFDDPDRLEPAQEVKQGEYAAEHCCVADSQESGYSQKKVAFHIYFFERGILDVPTAM